MWPVTLLIASSLLEAKMVGLRPRSLKLAFCTYCLRAWTSISTVSLTWAPCLMLSIPDSGGGASVTLTLDINRAEPMIFGRRVPGALSLWHQSCLSTVGPGFTLFVFRDSAFMCPCFAPPHCCCSCDWRTHMQGHCVLSVLCLDHRWYRCCASPIFPVHPFVCTLAVLLGCTVVEGHFRAGVRSSGRARNDSGRTRRLGASTGRFQFLSSP